MNEANVARHARPDSEDTQSISATTIRLAQKKAPQRRGASIFMLTMLFTAVQVWALVVVLTQLRADGVVRVALACLLSGAVVAVLWSWQETRSCLPDQGNEVDIRRLRQ